MYINILIIVLVIVSIIFLTTTHAFKKKEGLKTKKNKDYLDGIDIIYWINLDRSHDRRKNMEKMFEDPIFKGKKIVRISAVDGKAPNIDSILKDNFEGMQPDKFTKVEYACTLSHINAIREFSKTKDEVALIMEDDMTLEYKPYWKNTINTIAKNAPSDWGIIQLCINTQIIPKKNYTKHNGDIYFSTGAYIINQNGAKNLINKTGIYTLNKTIGHSADVYLYLATNTYVYKYPYFTYNYQTQSTIHPNHENIHDTNKRLVDTFIYTRQ